MSGAEMQELSPEEDAGFYEVWREKIAKLPLGKKAPSSLAGLIRHGWSDAKIIDAMFQGGRKHFKSDKQYNDAHRIFRGIIRHARRLALAGPESN